MNKKGVVPVIGAVAIILALIIFGIFLVNIAQRECNSNRDCSGNAYCNTKYECTEYPNQIIVKDSNWFLPSIIVAFGLIVSSYIFKTGKIPFVKKKD
jgi:hypothetical protein